MTGVLLNINNLKQGNIEINAKYPECETDGTRNRYSKGYKQFQIV